MERLLTDLPEVANVEHDGDWIVVTGKGELVNAVIITLHGAGVTAHDVQLDSSSREDAFVKLTGRRLANTPRSGQRSRQFRIRCKASSPRPRRCCP
jgi:hypothetical protein